MANVTDSVEIDKVLANVSWNNSNSYQLLELTQQGTSDNYTGSFIREVRLGLYCYTDRARAAISLANKEAGAYTRQAFWVAAAIAIPYSPANL